MLSQPRMMDLFQKAEPGQGGGGERDLEGRPLQLAVKGLGGRADAKAQLQTPAPPVKILTWMEGAGEWLPDEYRFSSSRRMLGIEPGTVYLPSSWPLMLRLELSMTACHWYPCPERGGGKSGKSSLPLLKGPPTAFKVPSPHFIPG